MKDEVQVMQEQQAAESVFMGATQMRKKFRMTLCRKSVTRDGERSLDVVPQYLALMADG